MVELFGTNNMADFIWEFAMFVWAANVLSMVLLFVVMVVKCMFISQEDLRDFVAFAKTREMFINKYSSPAKQFMSNLLVFAPANIAWISMMNMFYIIVTPGPSGLIRGAMMADDWRIIRLVKYEIVKIKE